MVVPPKLRGPDSGVVIPIGTSWAQRVVPKARKLMMAQSVKPSLNAF
jgi:hypothetical protein